MAETKRNPNPDENNVGDQHSGTGPAAMAVNQPKTPAADRDTNSKSANQSQWTQNVKWDRRFAAIIAIAAAIQAATSYWQGLATSKQFDAMMLDQRPWLRFESASLDDLASGKPATANVQLINSGKVPGTITVSNLAVDVQEVHRAIVFDKITKTQTNHESLRVDISPVLVRFRARRPPAFHREQILTPWEPDVVKLTGSRAITDDELRDILSGKKTVFIIAYVHYLDAANKDRETWASFFYNHETQKCEHYHEYNHMD